MITTTRAGLFMGLALSFQAFARAEDPAPDWGTISPQSAAWSREFSGELRRRLASGRIGDVKNFLASLPGRNPQPKETAWITGDVATVVEWQNVQMQLVAPEDVTVHTWFKLSEADASYARARLRPTREAFEAVLKLDPKQVQARRALATWAADHGDLADSRRRFGELLAENPLDADSRSRFAFALYDHYAHESREPADLDAALSQWAAALESAPSHADAWYGCGVAWLNAAQFESAEKALHRAIDADPLHWKAKEALIQALAGQQKFEAAKQWIDRLRELAPQLTRIGDRIVVAVLPRERGPVVVREALLDAVPWQFRIETFDKAVPGGKPIKIMELRRAEAGWQWWESPPDVDAKPGKFLGTLPELEQVLEEAK